VSRKKSSFANGFGKNMLYYMQVYFLTIIYMEARCMKCKKKKGMKNEVEKEMKNGAIMVRGECEDCGCKMCTFKKKD
jgi:hypothetical protein